MLHNEGDDDAQLDVVQLPGPARRRLHARQGRHRRPAAASRRSRSSSAVVVSSQDLNRAVDLLPAADGLGRRLRRPGVQHARAAHRARPPRPRPAPTATSRQAATTTRSWRSCCCSAPTSSTSWAGSSSSPPATGGVEAVAVTETRRAAGRDRQRPAPARLPEGVRRTRAPRPRADDVRPPRVDERARRAGARRIPLHRRRPRRLPRVRHRADRIRRASPRRSSPRRCRRSGRTPNVETRYATAVAAPSTLAVDPHAHAAAGQRRTADPSAVRLHLHRRPRGRLVLSTAATLLDGNPVEQLPASAPRLQPGRAGSTAPSNLAIAGNYAYMLCRSRPGRSSTSARR